MFRETLGAVRRAHHGFMQLSLLDTSLNLAMDSGRGIPRTTRTIRGSRAKTIPCPPDYPEERSQKW